MISQLHFATTNKAKVHSLQRAMQDVGIEVIPVDMDIPEIRSDETVEIARGKVLYAFSHIKKSCVALDGGFYIPALGGFPKAYVNFAVNTIGIKGILKLIAGEDRHCEFRDTIAYMDDALSEPILFSTTIQGVLADEPRGELKPYNWGEIDKIFILDGWSKTFAEMSEDEMIQWRFDRAHEWCGYKLRQWLKDKG